MNKIKTRLTILFIIVLTGLLGASCSGNSGSNFVGTWEKAQGQPTGMMDMTQANFPLALINRIEFLRDGTFIWDYMSVSGKYSLPDDKHIKFESPGGALSFGMSISQDTLVLTTTAGSQISYQRKK